MTADPSLDSSPVNLTELRKAGLARACQITGADPSAVVESSFQVWRKARHDVEPYLFPGVLETLKALQERGVKLVAITNGNAQTDDIPCLKGLFEICVMAEEVSRFAFLLLKRISVPWMLCSTYHDGERGFSYPLQLCFQDAKLRDGDR